MDDFDSIVAGVEIDETDLPASVADLSDLELVRRAAQVRQALLLSGEMTASNPSDQTARDLHSERLALRIELLKRGLN